MLNSTVVPCPRTHMYHVRKLGAGFVQHGYHYRELASLAEVGHLTEADVLYISNHFSVDFGRREFAGYACGKLLAALRGSRCRLVLWNFHTAAQLAAWSEFSDRTLHLGEDLDPAAIAAEPDLAAFRERFGVAALSYSSPFHPRLSRYAPIEKSVSFNFVGNGYRRDITEHCRRVHGAFIANTPPAISEPLRVNSFRRAQVNLVLHSPGNIRKGIVVERFAEALSLGGIIFHDHPRIRTEFAGLPSVVMVESAQDVDREYARILSLDETQRSGLRQASFEAWRSSKLSYFDQAAAILRRLNLHGEFP